MIDLALIMTEHGYQEALREAEIELAVFSTKYGIPLTTMEKEIPPDFDIFGMTQVKH